MSAAAPTPAPVWPAKHAGLAVASLVLGLIGVVFSFIPILNIITMLAAVVGGILGIIALFGTRRVMAGFGVGLAVLAVILSVAITNRVSNAINGTPAAPIPGTPPSTPGGGTGAPPGDTEAFGTAFRYQDGVSVQIDAPTAYQPSSTAIMSAGASRAVQMRVTVVNGSAKPLDLIGVNVQASAGDQALQQVFDSAKGVLPATQTLPPGARQAFDVVFGVPAGHSSFRVQIEPGFLGYQTVFFTGNI